MALHQILAEQAASITDLKRNPMGVIQESESGIVAILNRNQPAFYCITPELFSHMQELIEDLELSRMANERLATLEPVEVDLNDL
ncbi:type II toxin-antitoxin system Phd/YefM family antitoxin [Haemophilus influenzae]|nr:stability protein StbD [Haemophilus influenzae]CVP57054.1 primosomal protein DnaI [Streptococcus pneumoniae]MBK1413832.1 stability protein StbD [Haemophilus influenzae]MCK8897712.1 stability protein StbD [Haemophilus influenzae]MCK8933070.1 stability protein StbD [Haemophilus influenzae]MCK9020535.1 stability protein StbD [Haemophilus influenzae]